MNATPSNPTAAGTQRFTLDRAAFNRLIGWADTAAAGADLWWFATADSIAAFSADPEPGVDSDSASELLEQLRRARVLRLPANGGVYLVHDVTGDASRRISVVAPGRYSVSSIPAKVTFPGRGADLMWAVAMWAAGEGSALIGAVPQLVTAA